MHAEEDDIPEHLRVKRKDSSRTLAIVAIGSMITGAFMLMFAKPVVVDIAQIRKGIRFDGQQIFDEPYRRVEHAPIQQRVEPQYRQPQAEPITRWESPSRTVEQQPAARQTSFNDQNYKPSNPINILKFPEVPTQAASEPVQQKLKVTVIGQKDRKDICDIFKSGSLERRGCRQRMDLNSRNQ